MGYRLYQLSEGLNVSSTSTSLTGDTPPTGTTLAAQDTFNTRNLFNGGQIGLKLQETHNRFFYDIAAKLAIGGVSQHVQINGATVITQPGGQPVNHTGGILALPSNIGNYSGTRFGFMPEIALNAGYHITPQLSVTFGYTVIFLTNVVRPGDQIDLKLDPAQFPPGQAGTSPVFAFNDSNVWLQGMNLGIEYNY